MNSSSFLRSTRSRLTLGAAVVLIPAIWYFRPSGNDSNAATFTVRKGPLDITILGGGSVEALDSWQIRSEVRGEPVKILKGEVIKVGVLPDSQGHFISPDMKLYQCAIAVKGTRDWLKPGMSAKVEILVKQVLDTVYVPIQAVTTRTGKQVVFMSGSRQREREVETGEFNQSFIEIRKGLEAGENKTADPAKPGPAPQKPAAAP